jgi:hypothetical protein
MKVLIWLLIPVIAGLWATIYLKIKYRTTRPANAHKGMSLLTDFRDAMTRPMPRNNDKKNIE